MMKITYEQAQSISIRATKVLTPRTPITNKDLFSGRWDYLTAIADAVHQPGVHVILYGERGVGKTSLSNVVKPTVEVLDEDHNIGSRLIIKAVTSSGDDFSDIWKKLLREITWQDGRASIGLMPSPKAPRNLLDAFGLSGTLDVDTVRRVLAQLPGALFIIDEFDRSSAKTSQPFTDLIKALSDFSLDVTVMLVGVSQTIDALVRDHASINRSLVQIHLPRMRYDELHEILKTAEKRLGIEFSDEASDFIVRLSQGLPHYTHLIGLHAVRTALKTPYTTRVTTEHAFDSLKLAVKDAEHTTAAKYSSATHSGHQDALFRHVLLACAVCASRSNDQLGYFSPGTVTEPLSVILDRNVEVATFNNHLAEFAQPASDRHILERVGPPRGYRYRFRDPLLVPYIFMNASATDLLAKNQILQLLRVNDDHVGLT